MHTEKNRTSKEALELLKEGNNRYLESCQNRGDFAAVLKKAAQNGQSPYAVIVSCSDSRVIPETIFGAGIGELFVIRVAGNVIDDHQLGSIEYAVRHLGCSLVVVLGHTHCGAVQAALQPDGDSRFIRFIMDEIHEAIGQERDPDKCCERNVCHSIQRIKESLEIQAKETCHELEVTGAVYDMETGKVRFLQPCKT